MGFWDGTQGGYKQLSTLDANQQGTLKQLNNSLKGRGAGGAFGGAADYYYDTLSDDSKTMQMLEAPEMRRFNEQIIPGLSEQFAGMGAGGLSSSGFQNAAVGAGTDLSERLGAMRANLRAQSAQGLAGLGQQGLQSYQENVYEAGQPGFGDTIAPLAGSALGSLFGPAGTAIGGSLGNMASNAFSPKKGGTSPYGGQPRTSAGPSSSNGYNLPNRSF